MWGAMKRLVLLLFALLAMALAATQAAAATAPRAVLRMNQVGYRPADAKVAVLLSSVPETGATFAVVNASGHVVLRGESW